MLRPENIKTAAAVLVVTGLALAAYSWAGSSEIDVNEMSHNPFAPYISKQSPQETVGNQPLQSDTGGPKPELLVETATLKFLDARSLRTSITNMSGKYGTIEPDSKSNSLIICDTNENLAKILEQIRKVDRKPEQIMIEVVLLDVELDNTTEIGVNWDMLTDKYNVRLDSSKSIGTSFRQNLGFTTPLSSTTQTTDTIGDATAFRSFGTGSDFWLLTGDIRNIIHALQEKNNVEILASPRVMVVSGQNAAIEAVEEIPYRELTETASGGGTASPVSSTQFKNVGVKLNVGATLTDDKFILLNVSTEQSVQTGTSVVSGVTGTPIVDTRKVQSSLLLNDGQILVVGGLRRKDIQKQTNQLPILGDLPIVGLAFKATNTVENNSELLVILSPHIYNGEKPNDAEREKFNEITRRPLLTTPEVTEKKQEAEKEKARQAKEAEKAKKAQEIKQAKEAAKAKDAKKQ